MRPAIAFWLALAAAALVASSAPAVSAPRASRHAPQSGSQAAPPARQAPDEAAGPFSWLTRLFANVKPYPPGEGDADGLSRNIEDCNKGCIASPIR